MTRRALLAALALITLALVAWSTTYKAANVFFVDTFSLQAKFDNTCANAELVGTHITASNTIINHLNWAKLLYNIGYISFLHNDGAEWDLPTTGSMVMCFDPADSIAGKFRIRAHVSASLNLVQVVSLAIGRHVGGEAFVTTDVVNAANWGSGVIAAGWSQYDHEWILTVADGDCVGIMAATAGAPATLSSIAWSLSVEQLDCQFGL